jgi:hypothetical protein
MIAALAPAMMMLAPATLENRSDKVIDLFVQVCLRGEARFKKGEAKKVTSTGLPWRMGVWNTRGQFYTVRKPVEAFIAVSDAREGNSPYARTCRVGGKYVDVRSAADQVRAYLREPPLPGGTKLGYYEEYYLDGGAKFEVETRWWIDFATLTSYVLTPEAAERKRRKAER